MPLPAGNKKIRLCFYIVLNPKHGGICIYLTTGTTDLKRRYVNIPGDTKAKFKVRCLQGGDGFDPDLLVGVTVHGKCKTLRLERPHKGCQ